jgi:hypothetical protein
VQLVDDGIFVPERIGGAARQPHRMRFANRM